MSATASISRDIVLARLRAKFPRCWFRPGEEFDAGLAGSIWTGEGSQATEPIHSDLGPSEAFDMELWEHTLGIIPILHTTLQRYGWMAEWYDGGTVFLYPCPTEES